MTLARAMTAPLRCLSDAEVYSAIEVIGAEKLRLRQSSEVRKNLVVQELGGRPKSRMLMTLKQMTTRIDVLLGEYVDRQDRVGKRYRNGKVA